MYPGQLPLLQLDVSMRQDNEKHFFLLEIILNLPELNWVIHRLQSISSSY